MDINAQILNKCSILLSTNKNHIFLTLQPSKNQSNHLKHWKYPV